MIKGCLLGKQKCNRECRHCGWNPEEVTLRIKLFIENGLTPCKDGLERLIIKRKESEEK